VYASGAPDYEGDHPSRTDRHAGQLSDGTVEGVVGSYVMSCRAALAFAAVILMAGCFSDGQTQPPPLVSSTPVSGQESPVDASTDLGCSGTHDNPPENLTVYFDTVALPTSDRYPTALQTGAQGEFAHDPAGRLFAKYGLYYKPGHAFEVIVPDEFRARLSIGWAVRSWRVVVGKCAGYPSDWLALVGGYWVADPLCAELIVRSAGSEQRVKIGLGAPCPGQAPPPRPSDV
jgi:hypothetical protein